LPNGYNVPTMGMDHQMDDYSLLAVILAVDWLKIKLVIFGRIKL